MCESEGLLSLKIKESVNLNSQSVNLLHVCTHGHACKAAVQGWGDSPSFAHYFLGFRTLTVQVGCSHLTLAPYEVLEMTYCNFQICSHDEAVNVWGKEPKGCSVGLSQWPPCPVALRKSLCSLSLLFCVWAVERVGSE